MTAGSGAPKAKGELLPVVVTARSTFVRIHPIGYGPLWFGPKPGGIPGYRFDAPAGQYRTLYVAESLPGAFAETVLRLARPVVTRSFVDSKQWSVIQNLRDLRLAKVYDNGLLWHGVTTDICAGNDYVASQNFALNLYENHPDLDGIAYRSRHDNGEICYALFDRVQEVHLSVQAPREFRNERTAADDLMRRYNAGWDPMTPLV